MAKTSQNTYLKNNCEVDLVSADGGHITVQPLCHGDIMKR